MAFAEPTQAVRMLELTQEQHRLLEGVAKAHGVDPAGLVRFIQSTTVRKNPRGEGIEFATNGKFSEGATMLGQSVLSACWRDGRMGFSARDIFAQAGVGMDTNVFVGWKTEQWVRKEAERRGLNGDVVLGALSEYIKYAQTGDMETTKKAMLAQQWTSGQAVVDFATQIGERMQTTAAREGKTEFWLRTGDARGIEGQRMLAATPARIARQEPVKIAGELGTWEEGRRRRIKQAPWVE